MGRVGCLIVSAAALWLSGCAPVALATVGTAEATSFTGTKKTLIDHAVSNAIGEDCSVIALEETGKYCQEKVTVVKPPLYCYQTLGGVECHDKPDPYANGAKPLGSPPPVRVISRDKGWIDDAKAEDTAKTP